MLALKWPDGAHPGSAAQKEVEACSIVGYAGFVELLPGEIPLSIVQGRRIGYS